MVFALLLACATDPAPAGQARWPLAGEQLVVEVSAGVNAQGHATGWAAEAWSEGQDGAMRRSAGCSVVPARVHGSLAAVDVTSPAPARLSLSGKGALHALGPLAARDARWEVGDVSLIRNDGARARLEGALRFGDAAEVLAVRPGPDGAVVVRWSPLPGERVEVEAVNPAGQRVSCRGGDGFVELPWSAVDPAHPIVTLRSVRETLARVPNVARVRVRAVIETPLSLDDPMITEHSITRPPSKPSTWEPRRALRVRPSWG